MVSQQNIDKAINLVDKMVSLLGKERRMLKKRIPEAARGDDTALADVILFPYGHKNRGIISEIIFLILRGSAGKGDRT